MKLLALSAAGLAFLGRHGTRAVALSIFVGLLLPSLAAAFKPLLGAAIFAMLCLAFLRVDPGALRLLLRRPGLVIAAALWVMLAVPAVLAGLFLLAGLNRSMPELYFILILQGSAPALMSAPALAALMGLDVALTLAALVLSTAVAPLTAGAFSHFFLGATLIAPLQFALLLFCIIAGSAATAALIRRLAGGAWIETQRQRIDGLSVLMLLVFALAAMDGVAAQTIADPKLVLALTGLSFALALGQIAVTTLVFLPAGRHRAFAIGLLTGNRNIGLMMAATGFAVPDLAWLYFGLAQFPIYLLPMLLKPLAKRLALDDNTTKR